MIEAAIVVEADAAAMAMHASLVPLGFALKPLAQARLERRGVMRATLVWRCRGRGSSTMLNVTIPLAGLA